MKTVAGSFLALCLLPALLQAQLIAHDYSAIYEQANPAVVTITTDDGAGSGFLVTSYGHIATNYHVIRNSRYLAVQFADGRKVRAAVVAINTHYDMALLKINSEVAKDIRPLPILPEEKESTVKVGSPVLALGSPLNQKFLMTQGILSKVDHATVLGDFLLQAGNSGGPLLNCSGEVIGINTFGESNIGGAVRVGALRTFLYSPELMAETITVEPPAEQLPSVTDRYPVEILNHKVRLETLDWDAYKVEAGDFTVTAITPVLIGKVRVMHERMRASNRHDRRSKDIQDAAYDGIREPYYEWHGSTETALDYAVTFDIRPNSGLTTRGIWSKILTAPFFMFGRNKGEMEFKAEFMDFRLYRDGVLLEPIMPGRMVIEGSADSGEGSFVDQAYSGSYVYSPDEFLIGNEFRMEIIDARKPNEIHKTLAFPANSSLIQQLRSDFTYTPGFLILSAPRH